MKEFRKFLGAGLLVLVALLITFKFKSALGWSPDVVLPVLAAAGFLLNFYTLAFLVLLTTWILNWQPGLPPELWILAAVPFAAWLGKKFLPSVSWLTLAAAIALGEILTYALAAGAVLWENLGFAVSNTLFAAFLGLAVMALLEWVYEER